VFSLETPWKTAHSDFSSRITELPMRQAMLGDEADPIGRPAYTSSSPVTGWMHPKYNRSSGCVLKLWKYLDASAMAVHPPGYKCGKISSDRTKNVGSFPMQSFCPPFFMSAIHLFSSGCLGPFSTQNKAQFALNLPSAFNKTPRLFSWSTNFPAATKQSTICSQSSLGF
jgi:hypothetical protein